MTMRPGQAKGPSVGPNTGAPGPAGPVGPAGPAGPPGPAGAGYVAPLVSCLWTEALNGPQTFAVAGESFAVKQLSSGGRVSKVRFFFATLNASTQFQARIYAADGSTLLALTGTINVSGAPGTDQYRDFVFGSPVDLVQGTEYWVVFWSNQNSTCLYSNILQPLDVARRATGAIVAPSAMTPKNSNICPPAIFN